MKIWKMISGALLVLGITFTTHAQTMQEFYVPLYVATESPILDEFGNIISGSALQPAADRPKVVILEVAPGESPQPPDAVSGSSVESAIPGGEVSIGNLVSPALPRSGQFAASVQGSGGKQVFVRVYNAPTADASLFYGDSPVYTVPGDNQTLFVSVGQVTNLIRSADNDSLGRGMPDVWQHLNLGTGWREILPTESVGAQGMTVRESYIAGLNPTGPVGFVVNSVRPQFAAFARMVSMSLYDEESGQMVTHTAEVRDVEAHQVSWWAVPGRIYTLKASTNLVTGPFVTVADAITVGAEGNYTFENEDVPTDGSPVYYRVWVQLAE
jgi:hypothetical protein